MLVLPSELTQREASACLHMLRQSVRAQSDARQVVADASALRRFDSAALAVLLGARRECLAEGKTFVVKGLPPKLQTLAGLYGVAELLPAGS